MKKLLFMLSAILCGCSTSTPFDGEADTDKGSTPVTPNAYTPIELTGATRAKLEDQNVFGFKLYNTHVATLDNDENMVVSPLSVFMSLGMMTNCETGEPEPLLRLLNSDGSEQSLADINALSKRMLESLPVVDNQTTCLFANSVWHANPYYFTEAIFEALRNNYQAEYFQENPATNSGMEAINNWISDATKGLIPKFLDNPLKGTIAFVDATYFRGKWATPFEKGATREAEFTNADGKVVPTPFMNQERTLSYYEDENLQMVSLNFGNGNFSMRFLLPARGKTLTSVMENLNWRTYSEMSGASGDALVRLSIPKFELDTRSDMMETFKSMGYTPSLKARLIMTDALHGANVKIDETGAEAAAATVFGGEALADPTEIPEVSMTCDRPFAFIIQENSTGAILYIGRVMKF